MSQLAAPGAHVFCGVVAQHGGSSLQGPTSQEEPRHRKSYDDVLSRLSMELLEPIAEAHKQHMSRGSSGCDSSDCLFCHRQQYCDAGKVSGLLRKRSLPGTCAQPCSAPPGSRELFPVPESCDSSGSCHLPDGKRARRGHGLAQGERTAVHTHEVLTPPSADKQQQKQLQLLVGGSPPSTPVGCCTADELAQQHHDHHHPRRCRGAVNVGDSGAIGALADYASGWCFRSEWAERVDPAPARLVQLASLAGEPHSLGAHGSSSQLLSAGAALPSPQQQLTGVGSHSIVCSLDFAPDGQFLASGGVDKQLRLYNLHELFENVLTSGPYAPVDSDAFERDGAAALSRGGLQRPRLAATSALLSPPLVCVQRLPSKISCLSWCPHQEGVLLVGDYDGVLLRLHVASGHQLADVDAHQGRKIWSVAHSQRIAHLSVSAGDDGAARLWRGHELQDAVATLRPAGHPSAAGAGAGGAVCCADFSAWHDHLVALASSDRGVYIYDLRAAAQPLAALRHHARPVSYVRFFGPRHLVSASTDGSLAMWDLDALGLGLSGSFAAAAAAATAAADMLPAAGCDGAAAGGPLLDGVSPSSPWRVFRGHRNERNFVGLTVRPEDGLMACGSECSSAYAYHRSWTRPLASLDVLGARLGGSAGGGAGGAGFVSSVCWQSAAAGEALGLPPLLAAGTSRGGVRLSALLAA